MSVHADYKGIASETSAVVARVHKRFEGFCKLTDHFIRIGIAIPVNDIFKPVYIDKTESVQFILCRFFLFSVTCLFERFSVQKSGERIGPGFLDKQKLFRFSVLDIRDLEEQVIIRQLRPRRQKKVDLVPAIFIRSGAAAQSRLNCGT